MKLTTDRYMVCETYPAYINHIRVVRSGEALKPTGGLKAVSICGREITQGWDKPNVPLPASAAAWMKMDNLYSRSCKNCAEVLEGTDREDYWRLVKAMETGIIILRGVSGSGKTTLAEKLQSENKAACIISADDFFTANGKYVFRPEALGQAHADCFGRAIGIVREHYSGEHYSGPLIVDNTNTTNIEVAPYVMLANAYGVQHKIITVWCTPETAHRRGTHGVPFATVMRQHTNLMESTRTMPSYWRQG